MINTSLIKKKFISNGFQLLKDCLIKERIDLLKDTCEKLLEEKNHQDNSKHDINLGNDRRFLCHQHEKYPELSHFLLGEDIGNRPLLIFALLLAVTGVQLFGFGLLGELQIRTYHESQNRPIYRIRDTFRGGREV